MEGAALRELQAPLKQRYRDDPDADARDGVALRLRDHCDGVYLEWVCPRRAAPDDRWRRERSLLRDMLLQALPACAGVTLRSVATAMGVEIRRAFLSATGEVDVRGTLGVSREAPVGMQDIAVVAEVDTDADDAALEKLGQLTERYCVVAETLAKPPRFTLRQVPFASP